MKSQTIGLIFALALAAVSCSKSEPDRASPAPGTATPNTTAAKVVKVDVGAHGFDPSSITVTRGENVTLEFTRTADKTCADKVVFPDTGVSKDLPLNTPVAINVPTDQARKLTFQCGMGMYKSAVVVQ